VSEFFRNPSLFRLLEERLLPERLAACASEGRPFQAWFAGCATGDEVYSVALLLARLGLPPAGADLLGTDLDAEAIEVARAGAYEPASLREVPEAAREKWFEPAPPPRCWKVRSPHPARIQFRVHDVLRTPPRRGQDLVLCRNLMIYLEPSLQETVLLHLAAALRPGGVLALGRVERLSGAGRALFEPIDLRERTYRRARGV
jgi:chemotaxis methyl-accepting protein methylase